MYGQNSIAKDKVIKLSIIILIILALIFITISLAKSEKPVFRENSPDNPLYEKENNQIKPSLLEGSSDIGVILIHGLGATSFETKKLAEYLNKKNITTYQVLLAGHGAGIYKLEQTTSAEWYQSIEEAYGKIIKSPNKFIIGSSIGSLLALEFSTKKELNGIILFSTPITFKDKRIEYTPLLRFFKRFYHRDIEEEHQVFYHENFPLKTLAEMIHYINKVKKIIAKVNTPTLIIQSKNDPRIDPKSVQYIYDTLNSEKEIMWFNSNKHVLIMEYSDEDEEFQNERTAAFKKVYDFIIAHSK